MSDQKREVTLEMLKKSVDTLILLELCKAGATYDQIRKVVGTVDNNTIAIIKAAVSRKKVGE